MVSSTKESRGGTMAIKREHQAEIIDRPILYARKNTRIP
jgi:hypothetical protein